MLSFNFLSLLIQTNDPSSRATSSAYSRYPFIRSMKIGVTLYVIHARCLGFSCVCHMYMLAYFAHRRLFTDNFPRVPINASCVRTVPGVPSSYLDTIVDSPWHWHRRPNLDRPKKVIILSSSVRLIHGTSSINLYTCVCNIDSAHFLRNFSLRVALPSALFSCFSFFFAFSLPLLLYKKGVAGDMTRVRVCTCVSFSYIYFCIYISQLSIWFVFGNVVPRYGV